MSSFNLLLSAILEESKQHSGAFFKDEHCKIADSRDCNFDVTENRLAYTYKYGLYNILLFEKCFSNFLTQCSESDKVFPYENLKLCSLSNGPGLDIIGLLNALCNLNKSLNGYPLLRVVSLYESWLSLFTILILNAYEVPNLNSYTESFDILPCNISLIQCDIFSELSTSVKNCISNSNVLLLNKVYASSKANPDIFSKSLQEIFSLLQPGSLIFFVGSKKNFKQVSNSMLSCYVKCIHGPQKVTVSNIVPDEAVASVRVKPQDSGSAEFAVWQRIKLNKKRKKQISKSVEDVKELLNDYKNDHVSLDKCEKAAESDVVSFSSTSTSLSNSISHLVPSSEDSDLGLSDFRAGEILSATSEGKHNVSQNNALSNNDSALSILKNKYMYNLSLAKNSSEIHKVAFSYSEKNVSSEVAEEKKQKNETNFAGSSTKTNFADSTIHANRVSSLAKNMSEVKKDISCSPIKKVNKGGNQSIKSGKEKNPPEVLLKQNLSVNGNSEKCDKSVTATSEIISRDLNDRDGLNFNSMIQRCESLVTLLEKITADVKTMCSSRNEHCCYTNESLRMPYSCSCTVYMSCPSRNVCCCNMFHNNCNLYTNLHGRDCSNMSSSLPRPYITIPLQNQDVTQLLTSKKNEF